MNANDQNNAPQDTMIKTNRTVIGMELLSSLSRSTCCTCFRKLTKWLLSISWASAERRGAHLLSMLLSANKRPFKDVDIRFAISNVSLHFIEIYFANVFAVFVWLVHVNVHNMLRNHLVVVGRGDSIHAPSEMDDSHTLSRLSLCSSLTMKIISNLDKIVVWKSMF